jgi:putative NADH-flavin reductase
MAGRYVAAKAPDEGYPVRMLVRNPAKVAYKTENLQIVTGSVEDSQTIKQSSAGVQLS